MKQRAKNAQSWPQVFPAPMIKYKEANVNTQDENQNNQNNKNEVEDLILRWHPLPKLASDGSAEMK